MKLAILGALALLAVTGAAAVAVVRGKEPAADVVRAAPAGVQLGVNASLGGRRPFPDDNPWNTPVDGLPVDPQSDAYIRTIGADRSIHPDFGPGIGIPYVVVPGSQPRSAVKFTAYPEESDAGPYPIPPNPPIEQPDNPQSDRHLLMLDRENWRLYELFGVHYRGGGGWEAACGAIFDLKSNTLRPAGWTSADAAGLPIFPALVRYDEVMVQREVRHALRFTVQKTRRAYVHPARHFASRDKNPALPPMGMRVRLRADYDTSRFPPPARVVLAALKKYGMILADNGSDWFITGAPHPGWDVEVLATLKRVKGRDLEVVRMGPITAD